mmetsp:Transcript_40272/g.72555  ORF Transcript_40272/g.72555 Transcript_40272/m.72555 type:complete len:418 (-) Transcript_40272:828-2081(-)
MGLALIVTLLNALQCFERILGTRMFQCRDEIIHLRVYSSLIVFDRCHIVRVDGRLFLIVKVRRGGAHKGLAASIRKAVLTGIIGTSIRSILKATQPILAQPLTLRPTLWCTHRLLGTHLIDMFRHLKQLLGTLITRIQHPTLTVILAVQMTQLDILALVLPRETTVRRLTYITAFQRSKLRNVLRLTNIRNVQLVRNSITMPSTRIHQVIQMLTAPKLLTESNVGGTRFETGLEGRVSGTVVGVEELFDGRKGGGDIAACAGKTGFDAGVGGIEVGGVAFEDYLVGQRVFNSSRCCCCTSGCRVTIRGSRRNSMATPPPTLRNTRTRLLVSTTPPPILRRHLTPIRLGMATSRRPTNFRTLPKPSRKLQRSGRTNLIQVRRFGSIQFGRGGEGNGTVVPAFQPLIFAIVNPVVGMEF